MDEEDDECVIQSRGYSFELKCNPRGTAWEAWCKEFRRVCPRLMEEDDE